MDKLSTQPPKGTADWWPQEYKIRKYIFDTWRRVCESYGYQEYLTPLVELADVYRAKSGEDVGGTELTIFEDRGGREMAIRPEMTPSVTRMVADKYSSLPKPVRLFSIANFFRNEKPQKGRNREFWQLNFDVFGAESMQADVEILEMGLEIMKAFGADSSMFTLYLNDRELIETMITDYLQVPAEKMTDAIRLVDKFAKLDRQDFIDELGKIGANLEDGVEQEFIKLLEMDADAAESFMEKYASNPGVQRLLKLDAQLSEKGYRDYVDWNPGMVRGFDYYDGMVFEVFAKDESGSSEGRSLFGGGRYNGLAGIFGKESFPAVGCAPGDETTRIFLEEKGLIPEELSQRSGYYLPIVDENVDSIELDKLAANLRSQGKNVIRGLEPENFGKAFGSADKMKAKYAVILGERELNEGVYTLKDMESGEQRQENLGK